MRVPLLLEQARAALEIGRHRNAHVDEVSVLFATEKELEEFVAIACNPEWFHRMENFNSVPEDLMVLNAAPELSMYGFKVRFEFLRFKGYSWRIEAMCVLSGNAPLHEQALLHSNGMPGSPCVFHVSYKLPSLYGYEHMLLNRRGFAAEYRNSYGRFAYYDFGEKFYMKPRVNLRDM